MDIEKVWNEYHVGLRQFIVSKTGDPANTDDLIQDIWLKVVKNYSTLRDEGSVKAWIYQIANREIIDFFRRQGREVELTFDVVEAEKEEDVRQVLSKCIRPFLGQLGEEDAQLLEEIDLKGVNQKDYAERLGINYSTLKSRVQKSRSNLRSVFETCCKLTFDSKGRVSDFFRKTSACEKC